jgi:hypothetical protein
MKSKVKESNRELSARMIAGGVRSTDAFQRLPTALNSKTGGLVMGVHIAQYKIPDTTQFNI